MRALRPLLLSIALLPSAIAACGGDVLDGEIAEGEVGQRAGTVTDEVDNSAPATFQWRGAAYRKASSIRRIDVGSVRLDPRTRQSSAITFEVPDDAVSFVIHILDSDAAKNPSLVYDLVDPSGRAVISPDPSGVARAVLARAGSGQAVSPNAMMPEVFAAVSSTLVPNTPGVEVKPGTWKVRIVEESLVPDHAVRPKSVVIIVKRSVEKSPAKAVDMLGVLRFHLHIAPGSALESATADAPSTFVERNLPELDAFFGKKRLAVDLTGVDALPEANNTAALRISDSSLTPAFVKIMRRTKDQGVVDVSALRPSNSVSYSGIATLGGASATFGVDRSYFGGVIVQSDRPTFAVTMAHELGHHLGLFHTNVDNLPDTSTSEHLLYGEQTYAANLMTDGLPAFEGSASQWNVIHANPAVTWYRRER